MPKVSKKILFFSFHIDIKYREYIPMPYNCIRNKEVMPSLIPFMSIEANMHMQSRTGG